MWQTQPLITTDLPLMKNEKNVLTPLTKSILIPLGLTTAALVTDTANQKKIFGLDTTTQQHQYFQVKTFMIS